jgi:hypothetical protein
MEIVQTTKPRPSGRLQVCAVLPNVRHSLVSLSHTISHRLSLTSAQRPVRSPASIECPSQLRVADRSVLFHRPETLSGPFLSLSPETQCRRFPRSRFGLSKSRHAWHSWLWRHNNTKVHPHVQFRVAGCRVVPASRRGRRAAAVVPGRDPRASQ